MTKPTMTQRLGHLVDATSADLTGAFTADERRRFKRDVSYFNRGTALFDAYDGTTQGGKVRLGEGTQGSVKLGWDWRRMKKVAVKASKHNAAITGLREALLFDRVRSRYVARVYDVYPAQKTAANGATFQVTYLTMQRLGPSLSKQLEEGKRFTEERIKAIVRDALRGVQALHNAGVGHFDIEPRNIAFAGKRAVLFDGGLARNLMVATDLLHDVEAVREMACDMFRENLQGPKSAASAAFLNDVVGLTAMQALQHPWLSDQATPATVRLMGLLKPRR